MHQRALRTVLLIQAVEETDRTGEVIPLAERSDASRIAVRQSAPSGALTSGAALPRESEAFLTHRADQLFSRLRARSPAVSHILSLAGGTTWFGRLLLAAALLMGLSLAQIDGSRRINLLAFPLVGLVMWNLIVYGVLLMSWVRRRRSAAVSRYRSADLYERWVGGRVESLLRQYTRFNVPLTNALRRFAGQWGVISRPLILLHAQRLFHLGAAVLAIGLIAGLYIRGLALRYEAGWESTFLGPGGAHALLALLYGPAAMISGIALPNVDELRTLRWTAQGGGGNAAPWIHLIALTALLYIVLPRLLIASADTLRLWLYSRRPPIPPALLGYARTLILSVGDGTVREIGSVIPYAYRPSAETLSGLERLLGAALGANLSLRVGEPLPYGEEQAVRARLAGEDARDSASAGPERAGTQPATTPPDAAQSASAQPRPADWSVLLMNLAATPEVENHGALLRAACDWLTEHAAAAPLLVVIDEGPYAARMSGDAVFEQRVLERRKLWREFVAGYGLRACILDLSRIRAGAAGEAEARDSAREALWTAGERA